MYQVHANIGFVELLHRRGACTRASAPVTHAFDWIMAQIFTFNRENARELYFFSKKEQAATAAARTHACMLDEEDVFDKKKKFACNLYLHRITIYILPSPTPASA